jgi:hypothetical protein
MFPDDDILQQPAPETLPEADPLCAALPDDPLAAMAAAGLPGSEPLISASDRIFMGEEPDCAVRPTFHAGPEGGAFGGTELDAGGTGQVSQHHAKEISFGAAGACTWCSGSGVVYWPSGEPTPCTHCGGTGIGPV